MSEKKEKLLVVVDPGFSALKIIVNKHPYIIPSDVIDMTTNMDEYKVLNNFEESMIISECIEGRKFIVGEQVQKLRKDSVRYQQEFDRKKTAMESEARFDTDDFEAQLLTGIAYGIIQYSKEAGVNLDTANMEEYDIFIAVPLPHAYYTTQFEKVRRIVEGTHDFDIQLGNVKHHVSFEIAPNRTICFSQTMCLLLNEAMNDEGEIIPEREHFYTELPAIILDGGYGTFGIVQIEEGYRIDPDNQESNTEFAMRNVHEKVAEIATEQTKGSKEIKEYTLENIFKSGKTEIRYMATSAEGKEKVAKIDLKEIKEKVLNEVSENLVKHICEKYDNLLSVEQVIIGGGTGYAYAQKIKTFLEEERDLKGKVHLTDNTFNGKKLEPVYAVAAGMYKFAAGMINKMNNIAA